VIDATLVMPSCLLVACAYHDDSCPGLQIFEPDHETPPHVHETAHELFFILSGSGTAFCDGQRFGISAGDVVVFPPKSG
jgi:quercetin dioxygenase-like cupin family protein